MPSRGVNVNVDDGEVLVKGPKGELRQRILDDVVDVKLDDGSVIVERRGDAKRASCSARPDAHAHREHGRGRQQGISQEPRDHGVGYRAAKSGERLNLSLGYSHPVVFAPPKGIALSVEGQNRIHVEGIDKQAVGQVAAEIRALRSPEPYKGKGIRYEGERMRSKLGKAAKAGKK